MLRWISSLSEIPVHHHPRILAARPNRTDASKVHTDVALFLHLANACLRKSCMREIRTCRLSGGRRPARKRASSDPTPEKSPNKAGQPVAEGMEGRGLAKGNLPQQNASRTPSRKDAPSALERVRQAAGKDKKLQFTALLHHIYNLETLRRAYFRLKKEAAPGVDGETWRHYGEQLERNLQDLSERLKRGAYRAKPVRRVFIPKADGRQRPLGVPALEDKIVQRAAVEVLNAI